MLTRGFATIARLRWLVLLSALGCAVALGLAAEAGNRAAMYTAVGGIIGCGGLVLLAMRYRPAALVPARDEPALIDPPAPHLVMQGVMFTLMCSVLVIGKVGAVLDREIGWPVDAVGSALVLVGVAGQWYLALGGLGLRVRPDGVVNRQLFGSLFIPWEAFAAGFPVTPAKHRLNVYYDRPELVRKRGVLVSRDTLPATVEPIRLAELIQDYVRHPERRSAIGS
ncbi:hypothetical protein [Actinoplanes sp. NPDC051859]|uniref:hypothetical protein n=1 Tax=Actinoplanes sp. NPDC051859 TaxID=3363909 RepID=UPI0037AAB3E0